MVGIHPWVCTPRTHPGYTSQSSRPAPTSAPLAWVSPYRANPCCYRTVSSWRASYHHPFHCWSTFRTSSVSLLGKKERNRRLWARGVMRVLTMLRRQSSSPLPPVSLLDFTVLSVISPSLGSWAGVEDSFQQSGNVAESQETGDIPSSVKSPLFPVL